MKAAILIVVVALVGVAVGDNYLDRPVNDAELVKKINDAKLGWTAKEQPVFDGWTKRDARKLLKTFVNTRPFIAGIPDVEFPEADEATLSSHFDWRQQGNCVHDIRNQEQCGSCWAFGATEALTDRFCIHSNGQKLPVSKYPEGLSPEDLVSCDTQNMGCNGGYLQYAWQYMTNPGVVTNQCFPYGAGGGNPPPCRHSCVNGQQWVTYRVSQGTTRHVVGVTNIMEDLQKNGPQEVAFEVYEDFFQYYNGVYVHRFGRLDGGHAVKFVGWGYDSGTSQKYWIVANSWGKGWAGLSGYFWILRGVNECGIESNVYGGMPDLQSGH